MGTFSSRDTASRNGSAGITPVSSVPGQVHPAFLPRADGQEDGGVLGREFVERDLLADAHVELELHAQALDELDLLVQHLLGQAVLGQCVAEHAARLGSRFVDRDRVAQERQVVGAREAGGAGADDPDLVSGGLEPALEHAGDHRLELVRQEDLVRDFAVHVAHVHGLVDGGAAAAVVAGVLAHPARGGRQRVVQDHRQERVLDALFLVQLEEPRDVHMQRAGVLARRERQVLAHAGAAALRQDVVFELVPEVAHAREDRVRRAGPQGAERGVTDHPAQLVELFDVLVGAPCPR